MGSIMILKKTGILKVKEISDVMRIKMPVF